MSKIIEAIKTVNSTVRTGLAVVLVAAAGGGSYFAYSKYTEAERKAEQNEIDLLDAQSKLGESQKALANTKAQVAILEKENAEQLVQIEKLHTAMQLLKVDQRLARLEVVKIEKAADSENVRTTVRFVELSPNGDTIAAPKEFVIDGDVIYVDNWVVKFDDKYVEQADLERGTSLCLFRRIFGENQNPSDGFALDEVGTRPQAYSRGGGSSEFEQRIWSEFWEFANNPDRAAELGIRAANGEAVSIKVKEGMSYGITLRASGGLSIEPTPPKTEPAPNAL